MTKIDLTQFDYKRVGSLDAAMWRAYYNHHFLRLFWLLVQLIREQLGCNWRVTIRLAFYAAWAAADYRIYRNNVRQERVLRTLTRFYKLVSRHALQPFDAATAAKLELRWWGIHRSSYQTNPRLESSLADAAAVVYGLNPQVLNAYARLRAKAMILPQHERDSHENHVNWDQVEHITIESWRELHKAVQS